MWAAIKLTSNTVPTRYPPGRMGICQSAPGGPHQTKKLRNHRAWALKSPSLTCATVPRNTSRIPRPRQATVRRSEVMNLRTRLSMLFHRFDELDEAGLLGADHRFIPHHFEKPGVAIARHDGRDEARLFVVGHV